MGSDGVLTMTVSVPQRPRRRLVLGEQEQVVIGRPGSIPASPLDGDKTDGTTTVGDKSDGTQIAGKL